MRPVAVVLLAAGKGTRMRSRLPKVAHLLAGRPMLEHVARSAAAALAAPEAAPDAPPAHTPPTAQATFVVVLGQAHEQVRAAVSWPSELGSLTFVRQKQPRGTGDAVRAARAACQKLRPAPETVLVLYGDTPLVRPETLRALLEEHLRAEATLTFLTGEAEEPGAYGRVLRDADGAVAGIVEARHATPAEAAIREVNAGIYCFEAGWLWPRLDALEAHPNGELYLTDLVAVAVREGRRIRTRRVPLAEAAGVNDRVELAAAEAVLRQRLLEDLMRSGVTIVDPATTYVEAGVRVGQDTRLLPGTHLRGATVIGAECEIGPYSVITDSQVGDGCTVRASYLEEAVMEAGAHIGPMSHLRPGARLASGARLGNFAEVKNATLGQDVQMHHFSYAGDASIGAGSNIGAGTITVNYDGRAKHRTTVGERVSLGSDTLLIAPVTVGDAASTGAGSVVTRDVAPGALVVGVPARPIRRVRQAGPKPAAESDPEGTRSPNGK